MKNLLVLLFTCCISFFSFAQINFEPGYFIDNNGQKTECLIKNTDWKNNPESFEYKLSQDDDIQNADIKNISEFSINNTLKFIRTKVEIDRSSDRLSNLSRDRAPDFSEELVFLKVLVEGKFSLYAFEDAFIRRFFYKVEGGKIEQLIYKKYEKAGNTYAENNRYRQQLWTDIKCESTRQGDVKGIDYKLKDLTRHFIKINSCVDSAYISYVNDKGKGKFNVNVRARLNRNEFQSINDGVFGDVSFDDKLGYGFGVELEYIFPFNKNKWALAVEPTFSSYTAEDERDNETVVGGKLLTSVEFTQLEVAVKIRHYLFINKTNKLFVNASYILDNTIDSSIKFTRADGTGIVEQEIYPKSGFGIGLGFKTLDKFSAELRYRNSDVLDTVLTNYSAFSVVLGYTLF